MREQASAHHASEMQEQLRGEKALIATTGSLFISEWNCHCSGYTGFRVERQKWPLKC